MWDEISVNIPSGPDTNRTMEAIRTAVDKETANDTKLAEEEWKRAAKQNVLSHFTAKPSVDMRPSAAGVDVLVRYVTHASERYEMRNRIYESVMNLLHGSEGAAALPGDVKP